ncbi:MAG: MarR family transcriptional regulator [Cyclobacteriaceae bacterium]|nr:MarR family transcriptional regulator [Cyclobacteriaceae bacterium]MCH8514935.1 MarR family transcriptional regulator [Cyclobacteriaceae bacterium]
MSIEEQIKQKKFDSEAHKLSVNIMFTSAWIENHNKDFFKSHEITAQQYNVLRILRGQKSKPISTSDIRKRMIDKASDVSRIVARLKDKNLVSQCTSSKDKRFVEVAITNKGLDLLKKMDPIMNSLDSLMNNLNAQEQETLNNLLDKLRGYH